MANHQATWTLERVLPSQRGAGRAVGEEILGQLRDRNWSPHDQFAVRLALEEAITNAIHHGNQLDPRKQVTVRARLHGDTLHLEIADEGPGFDLGCVPDCTAPQNLDKPSGRGLLLIRSYMQRVEYLPPGNVVVMEKRRSD